MIEIIDVLTPHEVAAARETLDDPALFRSGATTAGWHAKLVKNNLQTGDDPKAAAIIEKVRRALAANKVFQATAIPRDIVGILISRYEPGMAYGAHVDDAMMGGKRTDMSFTLFLSEPGSYTGGELVQFRQDGSESRTKLAAGSMVLYPTSALHEVAEVTQGVRLAVVGWVRSLIRRADQREILTDLTLAQQAEFEANGKSPLFDTLTKTRSNLLRIWLED